MYCFIPVLKGYWKQYELWDGTYNLLDLLDIHEAIEAQNINEELVRNFYNEKAERENALRFGRR